MVGLVGAVWSLLAMVAAGAQDGSARRVLVVPVEHMIGPVIADHVVEAVGRAEDDGYEALVVRMDTPGGLDTSMRKITQRFLDAEVPVVVYVAPRGARAASAGAIITLSSHIAAMAPGTVIGAATPVDLEGGEVERKVINDAAALAESLAALRGRDVDFYVDTVRRGRSAPASEALEIGAVELVADSLDDLLEAIDGTEVELRSGRTLTLETADAGVDEHGLGTFRQILRVLADPNLAFLFLSIGTLGVIYELASPGVGAGGVVGGGLIVLAMFALSVLTVSVTGILFLLLAVALFVAEVFAPGIGVFAALGATSLLLSGLFLFDDMPGVEVSLAVVLPTVLVVAGAVVLAGRLALRARSAPSTTTGEGTLVGRPVTVRRLDPATGTTQALVNGGWWTMRSAQPLVVGDQARVVAVDGLDLVVDRVDDAATNESESNDE